MKIVEIREKDRSHRKPDPHAYIDFSKMTLSLVAVVTDVVRDGSASLATASTPTAATARAR